ncbi:MAG: hypothetical protein ACE365_00240 [Gammaproteobacteria bacterium]
MFRLSGRQFNERSCAPLNFIKHPAEMVMIAIHYYYRFKVSQDDVVELIIMRRFHMSHQTIHNWTQTFGVELGLKCRAKRKGFSRNKWHIDATYLRIDDLRCYFYRAILVY